MAVIGDLVLQTVNNPGTATFQLIAPPVGRRSFVAGVGTGLVTYYIAHDGTLWEEGYGTITAGAPDTLSRSAVLANSAGTTALINFTGLTNVYCDVPATRAMIGDETGTVWHGQARRLANIAAGVAIADVPRMDQVGWAQIGAWQIMTVGSGGALFTLPSLYNRFRVEFQEWAPASSAQLYFRVSVDGGATYEQTTGQYAGQFLSTSGGGVTGGPLTNTSYGQISIASPGAMMGWLEFQPAGSKEWYSQSLVPSFSMLFCGGYVSVSGTMTNLLFGSVGANSNGGRCRLLGALA